MRPDKFDNPMRRQVWSLPQLMAQQYQDLEPKTRELLTTPEIFSLRRIILTGCGDSFAAGLAAKEAFEELTQIPVQVLSAIDLARHYPATQFGTVPNTPLVVAVSNSGEVARVVEATMRTNEYKGLTIGVTGNASSRLAQQAGRILPLDIPDFESAPGVRSYMVSVLSLLLLAIRIGEVRGNYTMDVANNYRREIASLSARLEEGLEAMDQQAFGVAEAWQAFPAYDFIGASADYASAWYGHAKILEATGKYALHVNTEEWLHLNFFLRGTKRTGTVLVANSQSPSLSRAQEVAEHVVSVGRPFVIVTDDEEPWAVKDARLLMVSGSDSPWLLPLVTFVPLALLAAYIAALIGEEYGRGARGNWSACQGGATTRDSHITVI